MYKLKIEIFRYDSRYSEGILVCTSDIELDSEKNLTKKHISRILSNQFPSFRRRKGRSSIMAGSEILPVLEEIANGFRAWRLYTENNSPSGYEPPINGRVGKANSTNNPYSDRSNGVWECVDIYVSSVENGES